MLHVYVLVNIRDHFKSHQMSCLETLHLRFLYGTLSLFMSWIRDGLYDFSHIPFTLKSELTDELKSGLKGIETNYPGLSV